MVRNNWPSLRSQPASIVLFGDGTGLRARKKTSTGAMQIAEQVVAHAKKPLTIPVHAFGGEVSLAGLTLTCAKAVAPGAQGGVIERCGHWAAEERPDFVADMVRKLVKAGQRTK